MLGDLVCWKFHIFTYKPNSLYKRVVCRGKILGIDMEDLFLFSHQLTSKSSSGTSRKLNIIFIVPSLEDPNQSDSQEYEGLNKRGSDSPCVHAMCTPHVQGMPSLKLAECNWAIPNIPTTA